MSARRMNPMYLVVLVFLLGIFVARLPATIDGVTGRYDVFDPVVDVYSMLENGHVDDWSPELLEAIRNGAIDGMLEALDDPYAQFIPPAEQRDFEKSMTGEFVGIGAEVRIEPGPTLVDGNMEEGGYLRIITPLEDSPAYQAGILADDLITSIDGESTLPLDVQGCIERLQGRPGTPVIVNVLRNEELIKDIKIIRDRITVRAVRGVKRQGTDGHFDYVIDPERRIAYIRLTQFIPAAAEELATALAEVEESGGIGGIIIDLRGNPGGVLDGALAICDMFISDGVLVSVRGRTDARGEQPEDVRTAHKRGTLDQDLPVAVLVNGRSASASEIVSGALQDHDRAVIMGTRTFGKGLVQTVRSIPTLRGGQLKFTAQKYYLPSGRLIQREDDSAEWGVDPTPGFYIPVTDEEELARLLARRDLDIIREEDQNTAATHRWSDPEWIKSELHDEQLAKALVAMCARIDSGIWTPVSDAVGEHNRLAMQELERLELARQRLMRQFTSLNKRVEALADATGADPELSDEYDLWDADDIDLTNGTIDVRDADGNVVARLRMTRGDLERWLIDAGVKPIEDGGE